MNIVVKGSATDSCPANQVILNILFEAKSKNYNEVLNNGVESVQCFITKILNKYNFKQEDLKTKNYIIREETKYNEESRKYEFDSYVFEQNTTLEFDYNKELMAKLMIDISKLEIAPKYQINFSIKNDKEIRNKVLAQAYTDAEEKAQAIAVAAGKKLVTCEKVDFQPITKPFVSESTFDNSMFRRELACNSSQIDNIVNSFTPEDIDITETLYCSWICE